MNKSKIEIERNENGKVNLSIEGTKLELMQLLAEIANRLKINTNLNKKDILFAVELGLKDDEELEKEAKRAREELPKKIEKLVKELFDIEEED